MIVRCAESDYLFPTVLYKMRAISREGSTFHHFSVLSKLVGPVGQSDIFYECPTIKC